MTTSAAEYTEEEQVLVMRIERFCALGVQYGEAIDLAMSEADLHKAEEMIAGGCTPTLLVAILG